MSDPIDLPVDVTVDFRGRHAVPVTRPNAAPPRVTVRTASSSHLTSLSPTQAAVVHLVTRYGQLTTSMVRRALYARRFPEVAEVSLSDRDRLNSEHPAAIAAKMNRYVNAYNRTDGGSFPLVVWLAHDTDRVRTLQREANKRLPELFRCVLFDQALSLILGEQQ